MSDIIPDLAKDYEVKHQIREEADRKYADKEYERFRRNLSFKRWGSLALFFVATGGFIYTIEKQCWLPAGVLFICGAVAGVYHAIHSFLDGIHEGCSQAREKIFGKSAK